ncbi:MAG: class I SAM-dependent methyltransferase [Candidatus Micrarchaeota archaeon]
MRPARELHAERNLKGWESIALRWGSARWPRRPRWKDEFSRAYPLLSKMGGQEAIVVGATPEFRAMLKRANARVTVMEKSDLSLSAMTDIMVNQMRTCPDVENIIAADWESPDYEKNRYRMVMGDLVTGYLESWERYECFLLKLNAMLVPGGVVLLREFTNDPTPRPPASIENAHHRRWAYILTHDFAVEDGIFYEEKLAKNVCRAGDRAVLSTCADPPRVRLMPSADQFMDFFVRTGFEPQILVAPDPGNVRPGLWALWKR